MPAGNRFVRIRALSTALLWTTSPWSNTASAVVSALAPPSDIRVSGARSLTSFVALPILPSEATGYDYQTSRSSGSGYGGLVNVNRRGQTSVPRVIGTGSTWVRARSRIVATGEVSGWSTGVEVPFRLFYAERTGWKIRLLRRVGVVPVQYTLQFTEVDNVLIPDSEYRINSSRSSFTTVTGRFSGNTSSVILSNVGRGDTLTVELRPVDRSNRFGVWTSRTVVAP